MVKEENWRPRVLSEQLPFNKLEMIPITNNTMLNEYRLSNIYQCIKYIVENLIEGDFVECGVWKGGSVAMMAKSLIKHNSERTLHLFDIFDNICEPNADIDGARAVKDVGGVENAKGRLISIPNVYKNQNGPGIELNVLNLICKTIGYKEEKVIIHKGWFQDTIPKSKNEIQKISLLRLDGDWYESTKVCIENLYILIGKRNDQRYTLN